MGNTAKQRRLELFQDSDFAADLKDSKSTSGGTLCIFGSHTFVPISWMCKKQTAVWHSSTESEIISLDTGLDGLPALELGDLIVSVFGSVSRVSDGSGQPENDVNKHHKSQRRINVMENIDSVPSNVQSSRQEALLYVVEDNEAVIKMIIKGRSPTMRHVSRTHRVALDWLSDRINLDSKIQIKYIDTKNQLADIWKKEISHVMSGIILCVCLTLRIDDYWNIDGSRDLSDPWTGFTQFILLEEKPSDGYVVRWEINKKTAYNQARSSMARALEDNEKECQAEGETEVV